MSDVNRFTQVGVEAVVPVPPGISRVTQVGVEAMVAANTNRFTQVGVEVISNGVANAPFSQIIIILRLSD